jgi:hypothetical protein
MASVDHFKEFVKQSFGKITPPAEHKPHYWENKNGAEEHGQGI